MVFLTPASDPFCIIATKAVTERSGTCFFPNVKPPLVLLDLHGDTDSSSFVVADGRMLVTLPRSVAVLRDKVNVCQPERHDENMSYICQPENIKHLNPTLAANGSGTGFFLVQFQHVRWGNATLVRRELANPTGPAQPWQP